jgi:hypothetical protein
MTAPRQGLPLPAKLALAVVPAAFLLAAPLLIKPLGYLFEESFPTRFELPHSIVDVDSASGTPRLLLAHGEHDSAPGWHFVSGRWWPRFALTDGERAWPLLTDNYQGAWPYYLLLLLPESARNLDGQRQLAASSTRSRWGSSTTQRSPGCSRTR